MQQASKGRPFIGPAIVLPMLLFHLATTRPFIAEVVVVFSIAIACSFLDTIYVLVGFVEYSAPYPSISWLAPPWLTAIWVLYGMCLNHSLGWMRNFPFLSSVLGGIAAPLCYLAGNKMGAVTFLVPDMMLLGILAVLWAVIFPASLFYSKRVLDKLS